MLNKVPPYILRIIIYLAKQHNLLVRRKQIHKASETSVLFINEANTSEDLNAMVSLSFCLLRIGKLYIINNSLKISSGSH